MDEFGTVEDRLDLGPGGEDAAGQLHHGDQLERLDATDALDAPEIGVAPLHQPGERAGVGEELLGHSHDVVAAGAAAEQHGEQLGVAQRARAVVLQALLRTVVDGEVLDAEGRGRAVRGLFHRALGVSPAGPRASRTQ